MTVNQCICNVVYALLGVEDVHGTECLVFVTDTDNVLSHLDGIAVFSIETSDESISITLLNHRHTEVVALIHLVVSLFEAVALTSTLLSQVLGELGTATLLFVCTHIYDFDVREVELQAVSHTVQTIWVTQQDRLADTLALSLHGSLQHGRVTALCEYYALWVKASCVVEQLAQLLLVLLPVCDRSTCNATVHSSLGYCCRNLSNQTWVNWLWNEVLRTE